MAKSLKQLKTQFLEYIEIERGRSLKTVENYDHYLSRFIDFSKIDDPTKITDLSVREFRLWLNRQAVGVGSIDTMSRRTQNYYLIALRAFLKYLARQEIKTLPAERIELAKVAERSLDLITEEELVRFLNSPKGKDIKDLRDKAILELFFSTGLRLSELLSLTRDLNLNADEISIRGKGGKVRVVFLSEKAKNCIRDYLKARNDLSDALFVQTTDKKNKKEIPKALTSRSVQRIVLEHAKKSGISKKITPHTIRHLFATDLLSNGADIRSVQAMLGHSSIVTTQIYTHVTDKHLHDIHKKYHRKG